MDYHDPLMRGLKPSEMQAQALVLQGASQNLIGLLDTCAVVTLLCKLETSAMMSSRVEVSQSNAPRIDLKWVVSSGDRRSSSPFFGSSDGRMRSRKSVCWILKPCVVFSYMQPQCVKGIC